MNIVLPQVAFAQPAADDPFLGGGGGSAPTSGGGSAPTSGGGNPPTSGGGSPPPPSPTGGSGIELKNPLGPGNNSLIDLLKNVLNDIILPIGITVAVLFFVYAGFLFVTAQGSEDKIKQARSTFTWTVIGTAILLGAWTIAAALSGTLCEISNNGIPGLCS